MQGYFSDNYYHLYVYPVSGSSKPLLLFTKYELFNSKLREKITACKISFRSQTVKMKFLLRNMTFTFM